MLFVTSILLRIYIQYRTMANYLHFQFALCGLQEQSHLQSQNLWIHKSIKRILKLDKEV